MTAPDEHTEQVAEVIRRTSTAALTELREILQVLRDEQPGEPGHVAPSLTAVPVLVEELVGQHQPDLVLTDIQMPAVNGIEVTRRVAALPDPPPVVVLTTFDLDEYVFEALQAGASGFLLKDIAPRALVEAVGPSPRARRCRHPESHLGHVMAELELPNRTKLALRIHDAGLA